MASINDYGKRLSGFVQNASKKSEEMIDSAKLSSEINRLENNIDDLQFKLGKAYYEKYLQDETCEFAEFIVKINEMVADIQRRNEVLLSRKNLRNCPNCQTTVPLTNEFCGKCGMRLPPIQGAGDDQDTQDKQDTQQEEGAQDAQQAQKDGVICPYCGVENEASSGFCTDCGQKITASAGEPTDD